ncbi:MAG: DUF1295 domain-containing protein [Saprospiraceae bacterium]|nr:DUF1295 domain-containing protein [Saprospiraceae bacterium]
MPPFNTIVLIWIGIGLITLLSLTVLKIRAPYGRHANDKWGKTISNRWGWFIMELPALLLFPLLVIFGPAEKDNLTWFLVILWAAHYINRAIIFPFRIRTKGKRMPLAIVYSAIGFNLVNGFVNGYYLGFLHQPDASVSLFDVRILLGFAIFLLGVFINNKADTKLIALRKENSGYQIPRGWLFEFISCPNHFGEVIEWIGFAVIAWSLPALSFAIWSFCNLVPRAKNHQDWYLENFPDYPKKRKAVIPFLY